MIMKPQNKLDQASGMTIVDSCRPGIAVASEDPRWQGHSYNNPPILPNAQTFLHRTEIPTAQTKHHTEHYVHQMILRCLVQ
jgi:hypothetical protein